MTRNGIFATILGTSAALMMAPSAWASDPTPPPLASWTGFYAGVQIGGAWSGDFTSRDINGYNGADFSVNGDNGLLGGAQLGYNHQFGRIVVGIEGEYGNLGTRQSGQFPAYVGVRSATDSVASVDYGWFATVTGRVGFTWDRALIYGKAGWGWVDTSASFTDTDPIGTTLVSGTGASKTLTGAVYGGGIEFPLASRLSFKVEYEHFDVDDTIRVTAKDAGGTTRRFDQIIDGIDTVKVGFNLKLQ
jgi:outer membrane immunogenic protein